MACCTRPCHRLDDNHEEICYCYEHFGLINLADDLAEEVDALVERWGQDEDLRVEINNRVHQRCKLSDDIDVDSVGESVLNASLKSRLHGLW